VSWLLAFLGFAALIILHEFGHFVAAKATGMRVERFSLFFPPLLARVRRGETEYAIGAIPLGGYVKITGMSPHEDLPPEVVPNRQRAPLVPAHLRYDDVLARLPTAQGHAWRLGSVSFGNGQEHLLLFCTSRCHVWPIWL